MNLNLSFPGRKRVSRADTHTGTSCSAPGGFASARKRLPSGYSRISEKPGPTSPKWGGLSDALYDWFNYALSTLRPRWRRAARTRRPFLVDIRARKPWTLLRWRFLGWKVRNIESTPSVSKSMASRVRFATRRIPQQNYYIIAFESKAVKQKFSFL